MRKSICLLSASLLFLVSCSSDESSSGSSGSQDLLLKKTVEGDAVFGGSEVNYTYEDNKLVENNRNEEYSIFTITRVI